MGRPSRVAPILSMDEQEKQAMVSALRLLTATPKSKKHLKEKLLRKGFPENIVENVFGKLEKQGLLNEKKYASAVFETFAHYKPSGRKKIAFEMQKRGITQGLIAGALRNYSPEEEHEKAVELAKNKTLRWQAMDPMKRRKKLYDFLVRRGFDFTVARDAVQKIQSETSL